MSVIEKQLRSAWRLAVSLVLALGLALPAWSASGTTAQSSSLPETAAAAPESTVFFQQLDLDFEGAQWQQAETLLARIGLPDALDLWREEVLKEGAGSDEFSEADLDVLIGGEMAFFVTSDAIEKIMAMHMQQMEGHDDAEASDATPAATGDDQAFGMAAVLIPGDPDAAWDYAQRQVNMLADEENVQVEQAEYGDSEIIAVDGLNWAEDGHMMGDDPNMEMFGQHHDGFAAARDGDFIIAGPTQADVTGVIDVLNGDAPSLAEAAAIQEVVAQVPADALSLTYFDMQAIVEALGPEVIESFEALVPNMPQEAWGGAAALAVSASDVGFRIDSFSTYPEGADLDALLIANDPAIVASAERVPEGTFFFEAGILPPNSLASLPFSFSQAVNAATGESEWDGEGEMMPLPTPEQIEAEIAKATETLGFNPATDLFDLLGTEFVAFAAFPTFSMEGFGMDAVAAISTTDPVTLAETTRKVAAWIERSAPEADVSVRREGEDTLFVVSDPEMAEAPAVEFGIVGDRAVVALGDGISQLLDEPSTSLADDDQYQTVMAELPAEFSQVLYVDIGQAIAPIMMLTGEFQPSQITDADLACTEFSDQAEAQAAYDADSIARSDLDLDFDGVACEDAFAAAGATPVTVQGSLENLRALGVVTFQQDEGMGNSAILFIAEPGS